MKVFIILSIAFIAFTSCMSDNTEHAKDTARLEKEVASAVEDFRMGIINADRALLERITSPQLVFGHSSGMVQNRAEFIEEIISLQPNDYHKIDMTDQTITVSGDTGVVRHIYSAEYTSNGVQGSLRIGNVMIFSRQHGEWKLLARQAYRL
jgi:ketosteroid isomerase-like protein